jgi:hypothetical protein
MCSRKYLVGVSAERNSKSTREAEVGKLKVVVFVDEEVLRLQVSVKNTVRMAVEQASVELIGEFLVKEM